MENMTDQTRPTIVAYGPLYPYLTDQLEQRFTVHNVGADADMSALPAEVLEARAGQFRIGRGARRHHGRAAEAGDDRAILGRL